MADDIFTRAQKNAAKRQIKAVAERALEEEIRTIVYREARKLCKEMKPEIEAEVRKVFKAAVKKKLPKLLDEAVGRTHIWMED